jgi:hypothetical protein
MGLFRKGPSRRATRKAEAKALKAKAKLEAKLAAKNETRKVKSAVRAERKLARQAVKSQKHAEKVQNKLAEKQIALAEQQTRIAAEGRINPAKVKRFLGVTRILAPVLAPFVYRGVTAARQALDTQRAKQLGVPLAELGQFTGYGAKLSARIAGAERSTAEVLADKPGNKEVQQFGDAIKTRLSELSTAVRAAERMAPARRRSAHTAINNELDGIEADLLARLGVR